MTDESQAAPSMVMDTLDEWIAATVALIRSTEQVLLATVDSDGCLAISTRGFDSRDVPDALRSMANALERDAMKARKAKMDEKMELMATAVAAHKVWAETPAERKALCPACAKPVILMHENIEEVIGKPSVCTCGAFLMTLKNDAGKIDLRLLTSDEIADLPDESRMRLAAARKHFQEILGRGAPN